MQPPAFIVNDDIEQVKSKAMPTIPQAFIAFRDGWTELNIEEEPFKLVMEEDYVNHHNLDPLIETFTHMVKAMTSALTSRGLPLNRVNAFMYLLPTGVISKLADSTTQHLIANGLEQIRDNREYYQFLATKMLRSRFRMSSPAAFLSMENLSKFHQFDLMDLKRYNEILGSSGYPNTPNEIDTTKRESNSWQQEKRQFRSFVELEKIIFERTVDTFLNKKNGQLVVDDELIASKSKDVESKYVTKRKKGKEGPVTDCVACSLSNVIFGIRLRLVGDKQVENVYKLLEHLPKLVTPNECITLTFDRGYGKLHFIQQVSLSNYQIQTIAPDQGSHHPFLVHTLVGKKIKEWKKRKPDITPTQIDGNIEICRKWIYADGPYLGSNARVASKTIMKTNFYATVLRDVYDRKASSNVIRMFSVGTKFSQRHNEWIAYKSKTLVSKTDMFSSRDDDGKFSELESTVLKNCYPLTLVQRTADWFLMKSFRLTGTMAQKL